MPTSQVPVPGTQRLRPRTGRKPLQPKNVPADPDLESVQVKAKPERIEISPVADSNKENQPPYATPVKMECFDASLAEELSAVRKRQERLNIEKEKTETMLSERDLAMEMWKKEVKRRGEEQKKLEMEVDRLFRLKELRSLALRISPMRPLREKEREKRIDRAQSKAGAFQPRPVLFLEGSLDESTLPSPSPSPSPGPSPSPDLGLDRSGSTLPSPCQSPSLSLESLDSSEIGKEK